MPPSPFLAEHIFGESRAQFYMWAADNGKFEAAWEAYSSKEFFGFLDGSVKCWGNFVKWLRRGESRRLGNALASWFKRDVRGRYDMFQQAGGWVFAPAAGWRRRLPSDGPATKYLSAKVVWPENGKQPTLSRSDTCVVIDLDDGKQAKAGSSAARGSKAVGGSGAGSGAAPSSSRGRGGGASASSSKRASEDPVPSPQEAKRLKGLTGEEKLRRCTQGDVACFHAVETGLRMGQQAGESQRRFACRHWFEAHSHEEVKSCPSCAREPCRGFYRLGTWDWDTVMAHLVSAHHCWQDELDEVV